jgi:hypothetical protein
VVAGLVATACDPISRDWEWRVGKTHGLIVETTAVRASLGIYRVPTRLLAQVQRKHGVGAVQEALWTFGRPPELEVSKTIGGHTFTIRFGTATKALRWLTHKLIFDDPDDLRAAVRDAGAKDDCLALTLLSYGKPDSNWTHKGVGCHDGSLG